MAHVVGQIHPDVGELQAGTEDVEGDRPERETIALGHRESIASASTELRVRHHHDPTTQEFGSGMEGFTRLIGYYREAFPDLEITFDEQLAAGDRVVDRWTGRGTHEGELMGIPPTGRSVTASGISIHRIAETWNTYDAAGMLRQVGGISGIKSEG